MALLSVEGLAIGLQREGGVTTLVEDATFSLEAGEVMGLVGESGSGKTIVCRSLTRLLPSSATQVTGGKAIFEGRDLLAMTEAELRLVRGRRMAMVFQNPLSHLNPVMTIGQQIAEPLRLVEGLSPREAKKTAVELLAQVGIPDPKARFDNYPHEFSGGMRQRAMIAAALACRPTLLIADEPTTALDVTVQAQILRLLLDLRDRTGLAIVLITHDLGVVNQTCDKVAVMYSRRVVESGAVRSVLERNPIILYRPHIHKI
jgi:ABC-type dipeptide/oligopeptide/nickel transport system ATPase component